MGISPPTSLLHLFIRIAVTQEKILSHHAILRSAKIILIPTFPVCCVRSLGQSRKKLSWTTQVSTMSYSTVVFTAITIFVVVMSLPYVVMAGGDGENAESGGSLDYLCYLLLK